MTWIPTRGLSLVGALALLGWVILVAAAWFLGDGLRNDSHAHVNAAPFVGTLQPLWTWRVVPAAVLAALAIGAAPVGANRLPWPALLTLAAASAVVWALALALVDGPDAISAPLSTRYDYLHDVPRVASPSDFLSGFVDQLPSYTTHVRSHPPGMVLGLWALDELGLGGPAWATALVLAGAALAVAAVLISVREVAGEPAARRAAPFVALAPAAVFVATSADALFAGVAAAGVALVVLATGRAGAPAHALAATGGVILGAGLLLSYGLVLVLAIPAAVGVARRRGRSLALAALAGAAVLGAVALAGFWWLDGLTAARHEYRGGAAALRPYAYFLVGNLAVLAVVTSPATTVALTKLRDGRMWLLTGGAVVAVAVADLSGLSKGEVERIWLPFVPWIVAACCALGAKSRGWLAAHAVTGLALQVALRSPW